MLCITCGTPFTQRPKQPGLRGQCYDCGRLEERRRGVRRTLGLQGGEGISKSANISIWRNPTARQAKLVKAINKAPFQANSGMWLGGGRGGNEEEKPLADLFQTLGKMASRTKGGKA